MTFWLGQEKDFVEHKKIGTYDLFVYGYGGDEVYEIRTYKNGIDNKPHCVQISESYFDFDKVMNDFNEKSEVILKEQILDKLDMAWETF